MKKLFDFPKLIKSFEVAFQGLKIALREQTFRIFALVTLLVVILMIVFQIPLHQKLMLILIITFALALELINSQIDDEDLYPTSIQALTAKNWYQGKDQPAAEEAFKDMLETLPQTTSEKNFINIIDTTVSKVNQTIR